MLLTRRDTFQLIIALSWGIYGAGLLVNGPRIQPSSTTTAVILAAPSAAYAWIGCATLGIVGAMTPTRYGMARYGFAALTVMPLGWGFAYLLAYLDSVTSGTPSRDWSTAGVWIGLAAAVAAAAPLVATTPTPAAMSIPRHDTSARPGGGPDGNGHLRPTTQPRRCRVRRRPRPHHRLPAALQLQRPQAIPRVVGCGGGVASGVRRRLRQENRETRPTCRRPPETTRRGTRPTPPSPGRRRPGRVPSAPRRTTRRPPPHGHRGEAT